MYTRECVIPREEWAGLGAHMRVVSAGVYEENEFLLAGVSGVLSVEQSDLRIALVPGRR